MLNERNALTARIDPSGRNSRAPNLRRREKLERVVAGAVADVVIAEVAVVKALNPAMPTSEWRLPLPRSRCLKRRNLPSLRRPRSVTSAL